MAFFILKHFCGKFGELVYRAVSIEDGQKAQRKAEAIKAGPTGLYTQQLKEASTPEQKGHITDIPKENLKVVPEEPENPAFNAKEY